MQVNMHITIWPNCHATGIGRMWAVYILAEYYDQKQRPRAASLTQHQHQRQHCSCPGIYCFRGELLINNGLTSTSTSTKISHQNQHQHQPSTKAQPYKTNIKVLSRRVILLGGTTKRTRQGLFSKSCLCFAGKENYTCSQRPCCSLFDRLPSPGNSFTHTARHNSMTFKAILIGKAED